VTLPQVGTEGKRLPGPARDHGELSLVRLTARYRPRPTTVMSEGERAATIAKFEDMPPHQRLWLVRMLFGMGLLLESSVVELAVPVARAFAGRRGVQTGPALGSLLTFMAFQAWMSTVAPEETTEGVAADEDDEPGPLDRWLERTLFSGAEYLPAFGAVLPATVVLRKRSPLWGRLLWPLVRIAAVTVLVADASGLKKRHDPDDGTGAAGDRRTVDRES
jgi:hypothetical protein